MQLEDGSDEKALKRAPPAPILNPGLLVRRVVHSYLYRVCLDKGATQWEAGKAMKAAESFAVALRNVTPRAASAAYADQRLARHKIFLYPEEVAIYDEATRSPYFTSWVLRALAERL